MIKFERTEEGLQNALAALASARHDQDINQEGELLLQLSWLVKWVRSDTDQEPFKRSQQLARDAIAVFRSSGNQRGLARALIAACPLAPPEVQKRQFDEAEFLARELNDELLLGHVIAAKSRSLGFVSRTECEEFAREALRIYRKYGHDSGAAGCLFRLAIGSGTDLEKRKYAIEAYELHMKAGNPDEAVRSLTIAMMNCNSNAEKVALEPQWLRVMETSRGMTRTCYGHLAQIAVAKGSESDAHHYLALARQLEDDSTVTRYEQWESDVDLMKSLISLAHSCGNKELADSLGEVLNQLLQERPTE